GGEARTFPNGQELTEGELIDRAFSVSWAPRTPPASDELARRLRDVFGAFARGGRVRLAYRTVVYRARAAAG
ncbi:MAG TPA: hypothetical protein VIL46_17610, partial [Gemmataceae bacterium]